MSKLNNNLISISVILTFVFGLLLTSSTAYAGGGPVGSGIIFAPDVDNTPTMQLNNPIPTIKSINPNSINGSGTRTTITITITGDGFVPSSIVRKNNSDHATTFIDSTRLLVDISANDTYNVNGFYISVFNPAPGGGFSNAVFFTVENSNVPSAVSNSNTNPTETNTVSDANPTYGSLTANALLGSNTFMPSGLVQWIFFVLLIAAIIFLWRYIHNSRENYMAEPMKHA